MKKAITGLLFFLIMATACLAGQNMEDRVYYVNKVGMKFILIKEGDFMMGSPSDVAERDANEKQYRVTIKNPFYIQTTEVTQGQWKSVMGYNPSFFRDCGDECPVEQVSWYEVQEFIKRLNREENSDTLEGTRKYRLPTEAEWEYVARAGTTSFFNTGNCLLTTEANYNGNFPLNKCPRGEYRVKPFPVGSFPANAWGLYDIHGNVSEWVQDWNGRYPEGQATDPAGPAEGTGKIFRGGSWSHDAWSCRSAIRYAGSANGSENYLGFRLMRLF